MKKNKLKKTKEPEKKTGIFSLLGKYKTWVLALLLLTITSNALNLAIPKIIAGGIDTYSKGTFILQNVLIEFSVVAVLIFVLTYLQSIVQTFASEKVAKDLREELTAKISNQEYQYIQKATA